MLFLRHIQISNSDCVSVTSQKVAVEFLPTTKVEMNSNTSRYYPRDSIVLYYVYVLQAIPPLSSILGDILNKICKNFKSQPAHFGATVRFMIFTFQNWSINYMIFRNLKLPPNIFGTFLVQHRSLCLLHGIFSTHP